jgi:hypothetical protein
MAQPLHRHQLLRLGIQGLDRYPHTQRQTILQITREFAGRGPER